MSKTINKISKLTNAESFLQMHFVKGYKYVDRAGEIVNYFHKENKPPVFSMDLNGLDIFNPDEKINSIKISPKSFWAHFITPDSLEQMDNFFGPKAQDILQILDVKEISRIGWRSFFVYEFNTDENREAVLKKFIPIDNLVFEETAFTTTCKEVNLIIRLRKVKNDKSSLSGLFIDIDLYQTFETLLSSIEVTQKLKEFKEVIRSDELLALVNEILN